MLKPITRRSQRVQVALQRYAANDEGNAISALHSATGYEWLLPLAANPVEELFLVAACAVAKR